MNGTINKNTPIVFALAKLALKTPNIAKTLREEFGLTSQEVTSLYSEVYLHSPKDLPFVLNEGDLDEEGSVVVKIVSREDVNDNLAARFFGEEDIPEELTSSLNMESLAAHYYTDDVALDEAVSLSGIFQAALDYWASDESLEAALKKADDAE